MSGEEVHSCYSRERISEDFVRNTLHSFEEDQETARPDTRADSETTTSTLQGDNIKHWYIIIPTPFNCDSKCFGVSQQSAASTLSK